MTRYPVKRKNILKKNAKNLWITKAEYLKGHGEVMDGSGSTFNTNPARGPEHQGLSAGVFGDYELKYSLYSTGWGLVSYSLTSSIFMAM
jgi:hypothetical protein